MSVPNPGSAEAIALGCLCPVEDNNYGEGNPHDETSQFWVVDACRVHTYEAKRVSGMKMWDYEWAEKVQAKLDAEAAEEALEEEASCASIAPEIAPFTDSVGVSATCNIAHWDGEVEITQAVIVQLRELDARTVAKALDARTRSLEQQTRRNFIELGLICCEVERRELWKELISPHTREFYHSRDAWMSNALNVSRRSAYSAMKVLKALRNKVAPEDLCQMPRVNAMRLAEMSSVVQNDPEMVEKAMGPEKEFIAEVQKKYPEQHAEAKREVVAKMDDSARTVMEEATEIMRWAYDDVETRAQVLEMLSIYFIEGPCEREGYTKLTNRAAFDLARERGLA